MRITDTQGRTVILEKSFLETGMFGDGSDGTPNNLNGTNTFSFASKSGSVYTLIRSVFAVDLTVAGGVTLVTAGFKIFCSGTLTNSGTITNAGNPGSNGTTGGGAGAAGTAIASAELGGSSAGGTGAAGAVGSGSAGAALSVAMGGRERWSNQLEPSLEGT